MMNPQLASILAVLFLLLGGTAVYIMVLMTGKTGDQREKTSWIRVHRILGYLFLFLFFVISFFMIRKVGGFQEELSARAVIHIVLALSLIPLLLVKVLVVRKLPQFTTMLPLLGISLFTISFMFIGISAGNYILHRSNFRYARISALDDAILDLDLDLGKTIMGKKCSKCHSLERVYRAVKSDDGWAATVNKMAVLDSPNITTFDVKQTLYYLMEQQKIRQEQRAVPLEDAIGKTLISAKCSICHDLDRIFGATKDKQGWIVTVDRMVAKMNDPEFLSKDDRVAIITFLEGRVEDK